MTSNEQDYIIQDFTYAADTTNCDFRYVLRNLLARGAEEANYRSRLSYGGKAQAYTRMKLHLLDVIDDLGLMIGKDGSVYYQYRHTIRQAVVLSRYLIAIEREETASQFEMLEGRLKNPRRRNDCEIPRVA